VLRERDGICVSENRVLRNIHGQKRERKEKKDREKCVMKKELHSLYSLPNTTRITKLMKYFYEI
jgi:hypothetical protein